MTQRRFGWATGRWRRVVSGCALAVLASGFTGHRLIAAAAETAIPDDAAAAVDKDAVESAAARAGVADAAATEMVVVDAPGAEAAFVAADGTVAADAPEVVVAMVAEEPSELAPALAGEATDAQLAAAGRAAAALPDGVVRLVRRAFPTHGTELAWRGVHGGVDGALWRRLDRETELDGESERAAPAPGAHILPPALRDVGFPGIERIERLPPQRRRAWRRMVSWRESPDAPGTREPIPHVRCMGLSPKAVARRAARYEPLILEYALEYGVSASLVKAVISVESCFDPKAVSHVGAIGLMQLMPATARWLRAGDPRNARNNLRAGTRYLASLQETFGDTTLALAAYNAGPGNVRRYGGVPPFRETREYVRKVRAHHRRYVAATALAAR